MMNPGQAKIIGWSGLLLLSIGGCLSADIRQISHYNGSSDASAAAAVDNRYFIVGDDEHDILRMYSIDGPPDPVFSLDITSFLIAAPEHPEADIEAAARLGPRIYWITSHGRNKDGQIRPSRYRFFATEVQKSGATDDPNRPPRIIPVGKICATLVSDMLASSQLNHLKLRNVTRLDESLSKKEQVLLAPKEKGLNIEGLAVGPDGRSLWIALRNPLYQDASIIRRAIVIPLLNPSEVVEEGKPARFGEVILLDLGERGIRSIDYMENQKEYWIVAGSAGSRSQADFSVFRYRHEDKKLTTIKVDFPKEFTPEGLFAFPGQKTVCFISDDGAIEKEVESPADCIVGQLLPNGHCPNKSLVDLNKRTFRIYLFNPVNP
jgi:hypothetical protein